MRCGEDEAADGERADEARASSSRDRHAGGSCLGNGVPRAKDEDER